MSDYLATTLIIETGRKVVSVTLRRPVTLAEIWDRFAQPGRNKPVCTLCKGTARVSF